MTYPDLTIYATREPDGRLVPVAVAIGSQTLPILRAGLVADPNATTTGTRAMVGEVRFQIGDFAVEEVESVDDVPELRPIGGD
jgi:hypothetical protein